MAKRISDEQRLEQIFNGVDLPTAQRYLAICGAILRARFPQSVKVQVKGPRRPRKVNGVEVQPNVSV